MHRAAAALALVAFVACVSNDVTNPNSADIAGSYSLRSINGQPLPFVIQVSGADTSSLLDDTYTLTADSRFSEIFHTRNLQFGTVQMVERVDSGTFTRSGQSLRMVGTTSVFTLIVKTDTLQQDLPNTTFIYKK